MTPIFKTQFGSHVYGTNSETSDLDYKGIFIADIDDVILKSDNKTIHEDDKKSSGPRNTVGDVDMEWIELRKFLKDACDGQTYALDMLWTPEKWWITESPIWREIVANREKFLCKDVGPFVGYAMRQAAKYGLKGSRLSELRTWIDWCDQWRPLSQIHEHQDSYPLGEYSSVVEKENNGKTQAFIKILEKHFPVQQTIKELRASLQSTFDRYGNRAIQAMDNDGVDWKAISHAYRASIQLIDIAVRKHITFPLFQADFLKDVKYGKKSWEFVGEDLPRLIQVAKDHVERSNLPDTCDRDFWNRFILKTYKDHYGIQTAGQQ